MSKPEDKNPPAKPARARAGLGHDVHGNAVWQWAVDSGRQLMESTSLLLKRLDVPGLKLEDDVRVDEKKSAAKPGRSAAAADSAGYDPYGHKRVEAAPRRRPAATKPVAAPRPRQSWWQRLLRRR